MKLNQWQEVINTNLSSNFVIIKSALPNMLKNKKGKIIGISVVACPEILVSQIMLVLNQE